MKRGLLIEVEIGRGFEDPILGEVNGCPESDVVGRSSLERCPDPSALLHEGGLPSGEDLTPFRILSVSVLRGAGRLEACGTLASPRSSGGGFRGLFEIGLGLDVMAP